MRPEFRTAFRRLFAIRLVGTVSLRFAYPFIVVISSGLDASIGRVGVAIAFGEAAGLLGPIIGRRIDHTGRQRGMVQGSILAAVGCAIAGSAPGVLAFGGGLFLVSAGRYFYDVALGAWIGDQVPFSRRGRVTGIAELAWSGAFLLGVPIAGLTASVSSWRVPYLASAVLFVAFVPMIRRSLADDPPAKKETGRMGLMRPGTLHMVILFTAFGAGMIFVTEGAWFSEDFGMTERAVSFAVVALGAGEMLGSLSSAWLADRIGKIVSVRIGLTVLAAAVAAVAAAGSSQLAGVAAALFVGLGFELALVSALPLVVEISQARRAAALGLAFAAVTGTRMAAAIVGTSVFEASGIAVVVMIALPSLIAAGAATLLVREPVEDR